MEVDLAACARGDPAAWSAFVRRAAPILRHAVTRTFARHGRSGEEADVEEAVQEVYVRLVKDDYRLLRTFDPLRASLATWLTVVARSAALDFLRRGAAGSPLEGDPPAPPPAPRADPVEVPAGLLSPRQELVLRMLFDEGKSPKEAASILGVDVQTVRSAKHKALTALRRHFGGGK
ncbi:MAG TPA: sigma-70 family RNA polymerase sigma factor [Planctomycetota bacterium]|jgi:RNA polymerase sigma-70 factor (ECF subfamily)|nr:sigma-70 family RNA polymerase sigma factor [Planctomycetota bacterium]